MDARRAAVLPARANTIEQARIALAVDGTALIQGVQALDDALATARALIGDRLRRLTSQFEVTPQQLEQEAAAIREQPADERGRRRYRGPMEADQPAHNDGFGFGDLAPDHMFLWCASPCSLGGASFLVDAARLLAMLSEHDPGFGSFAWTVPIDHSVPNFPQPRPEPIARMVGGRVQVRCHPDMAVDPTSHDPEHRQRLDQWMSAVHEARTAGPQFRLRAGDLLCIDNYRMLHGRNGYVDPERSVTSIWAWTSSAVIVPDGPLDIARPRVA